MSSWTDLNALLVKEHVGFFKAANEYDVYDPSSGQTVLLCREPKLGIFTKLFRFSDYKRNTPFDVHVTDADGNMVVRVRRSISLFLSKVRVYDADDQLIGMFKQKLFSIGGAFTVLDENEQPVCMLRGKWTSWNFKFLAEGVELAEVSKQWSGIGKELFTSADNYMLSIRESVPRDGATRKLILAAVMCIDMVLKE